MTSQVDLVESYRADFGTTGIPEHLWRRVHNKLQHSIPNDVDSSFELAATFTENGMANEDGAGPCTLVAKIDLASEEDVWLVDHSWTFNVPEVKRTLAADDELRQRVSRILGGNPDMPSSALADELNLKMHRDPHSRWSEWFLLDEIGSAVGSIDPVTDDKPCVKIVPLSLKNHSAVSVMWVTRQIEAGTVITADFSTVSGGESQCPGVATLLWSQSDFEDLATDDEYADQDPKKIAIEAYEDFHRRMKRVSPPAMSELVGDAGDGTPPLRPQSRHSSPNGDNGGSKSASKSMNVAIPSIYTENDLVRESLAGDSRFRIAANSSDVDVIWGDLTHGNRNVRCVGPLGTENRFCDQPSALLYLRERLGNVAWLPVAYETQSELHLFAGDYLLRDSQGRDNMWVMVPTGGDLAGDPPCISDHLQLLLRVGGSAPLVVSKRIDRPLLYRGKEFDLVFIVAVRTGLSSSTKISVFDRCIPRLSVVDVAEGWASAPTVVDAAVRDDVVEDIVGAIPGGWAAIRPGLNQMLKDIFSAVLHDWQHQAPDETPQDVAYGGVYCVTATFTETPQPYFTGMSQLPECEEAVAHFPQVFSDAFATLFLDQEGTNFTAIR